MRGGHISSESIPSDTSGMDLPVQEVVSERGDSGGAIASVDSRLIGIHKSIFLGKRAGLSASWYDVLKLISLFASQ